MVSASVCATFVSVYLRLAQGLDNRFSANVESKKETNLQFTNSVESRGANLLITHDKFRPYDLTSLMRY